MNNETFNTTVTDLVNIFRGALQAIIPWADRAKIPWRKGEKYDDWDNISHALYSNIVCSSLYSSVMEDYPIARYDIFYKIYTDKDYLIVKSDDINGDRLAFVSFDSIVDPIDVINVAVLDENEDVKLYKDIKYNNQAFALLKKNKKEVSVIEEISVTL